jgi:hypothetical protein
MKRNITLTVTSLLTILLFSLHWADEVARGLEPGTMEGIWGFVILGVWLSATLAFGERRWGLVLVLLLSILAAGVPVLHMQGRGLVEGRYGQNSVLLFWVWTNIALGASGIISAVLAMRALWTFNKGRALASETSGAV